VQDRREDISMEITVSDFGDTGKRVTLVGRLDILGAEKIDLPLAVVAGSHANIVVDMGGVDFIASIGIRHLVLAAKTVARNSRALVLLNPKPLVSDVLATAGLLTILPIVTSEQEAAATLSRYAG
jgi:anti-anti-sigma factor